MKKALGLGCLLLLLGANNAPAADLKDFEEVMKEAISTFGKTGEVLGTIKDKASADKAKPELKKLREKIKGLETKSKKLGKPTEDQEKELTKKYKKSVEKAITKMRTELIRLATEDYAKDALKELAPAKKEPKQTPKKD